MGVTRKDIARLAGVSTATVSYVINGSNRVGEKTKERVWQVIRENNYHPSLIARTMTTNKSMQIAFLIDNFFNAFFSEIITSFEAFAAERGYLVSVCSSVNDVEKYVDSFIARRIDGVFSMVSPDKIDASSLYRLADNGIPVLVSGIPSIDITRVSLIEPDYSDGMCKLIGYLKSMGHRKIAYLSAFPFGSKYDIRLESFINAYDADFAPDEKLVIAADKFVATDYSTGAFLTERFLNNGGVADAIVTTTDDMAFGCIETLRRYGIDVPAEVSVVGIDNLSFDEHAAVPLTSLGFDKREFAKIAFDMLYSAMTEEKTSVNKCRMFIAERSSVKAI